MENRDRASESIAPRWASRGKTKNELVELRREAYAASHAAGSLAQGEIGHALLAVIGAHHQADSDRAAVDIHELADEYDGRIVTGEVNVDENPQVTMKYKVRNIPTVLFFRNGEVIDKQVGAVPKSTYKNLVEKYL